MNIGNCSSSIFGGFKREPEKHYYEESLYCGVYVPKTYKDKVLKHILLNYAGDINGFSPSLFLAIQGTRGEGKTFMLNKLCEHFGINAVFISGSELCGPNEGDSKNTIKSKYETACVNVARMKTMSLIVIDDFHLSIAADHGENVSKTTNSQVLISYLMNLADYPYICDVRVPIILLGNNFTNIYPALIRSGRTDFFTWMPTVLEKESIVYHLFRSYCPNILYEDVKKIINYYPEESISFFSSLIHDIYFDNFENVINEFERQKGVLPIEKIKQLVTLSLNRSPAISFEILSRYASQRASNKGESFE